MSVESIVNKLCKWRGVALTFTGLWPPVEALLAFKPWNKRDVAGAVQDSDSAKPPYRVEVDTEGCKECSHGTMYAVVGPDDVQESTTWEDKEHAEDVAESLSKAFEQGLGAARDALQTVRRLKDAERELSLIDEAFARRPALEDYRTRYERAYVACEEAARANKWKLNYESENEDKKRAQSALERDRSIVAEYVTKIKKAVQSRQWLTEGRWPYEWNDDNWHKEFAAAAQEILDAVEPLAKIAADWSNCPRTSVEVKAARDPKITGPLVDKQGVPWEAQNTRPGVFIPYPPPLPPIPPEVIEAMKTVDGFIKQATGAVELKPQDVTISSPVDPPPFNEYLSPADRAVVDGLENSEMVPDVPPSVPEEAATPEPEKLQ